MAYSCVLKMITSDYGLVAHCTICTAVVQLYCMVLLSALIIRCDRQDVTQQPYPHNETTVNAFFVRTDLLKAFNPDSCVK